jgi:hypothetical protein
VFFLKAVYAKATGRNVVSSESRLVQVGLKETRHEGVSGTVL